MVTGWNSGCRTIRSRVGGCFESGPQESYARVNASLSGKAQALPLCVEHQRSTNRRAAVAMRTQMAGPVWSPVAASPAIRGRLLCEGGKQPHENWDDAQTDKRRQRAQSQRHNQPYAEGSGALLGFPVPPAAELGSMSRDHSG